MSDWDRIIAESLEALDNPRPGDIWDEMLFKVLYVVSVDETHVTVLRDRVEVDRDHYRFDETKPRRWTREEFKRFFLGGRKKPWAIVTPRRVMDYQTVELP